MKKMKTVNFTITRESVDERVFATSAYTARAREAMGIPPAVSECMVVTADNKKMMDPLTDNAVNEVLTYIARYFENSSVNFTPDSSGGCYTFNIGAPDNFPSGNGEKLQQSIGSYIANRILQSWYTGIKPDEASIIALQTQNDAATIQMLLAQREKPTSRTKEIQ